MDGILNIYKEKDYTSFDVVAKLRGILQTKKIGHTGTLDPMAEGVLVVLVGRATALSDLLTDKEKTYEAVMHLGQTTDTEDCTGNILEEKPVLVTEQQIITAVLSFRGTILQVPPMYSAKKVNGKKLYDLARKGEEVPREAVSVTIRQIQVVSVSLPDVRIRVTCSKGTYIRTLIADIGEKLGCGACMKELVRTRSGDFTVSASHKLNEVEQLQKEGRIEDILLPTDTPFLKDPRLTVTEEGRKRLLNGNPLPPGFLRTETGENPDVNLRDEDQRRARVRVADTDGTFIGIYRYRSRSGLYWPEKVFLGK